MIFKLQKNHVHSLTYVYVLQYCIENKATMRGELIHVYINNIILNNVLINIYAKGGSKVDARNQVPQ